MPSERYGEHMKKETVVWITKYLLDFMYFAGIVATVTLPWSIKWIARVFQYEVFVEQYKESVLIYFILGILAILIIGELRKMFRTVLADDCFVRENVVSLQRMGTYSFIIAIICLLRTVLYLTVTMTLVLVFVIAGLFSKVLAFVDITLANLSILKNNKAKAVRLSTLDAICKALDCQPGDILEYVADDEAQPEHEQ